MNRIEQLLATVKRGERELTLDMADASDEQRAMVRAMVAERGLHLSGTSRWFLIRAL